MIQSRANRVVSIHPDKNAKAPKASPYFQERLTVTLKNLGLNIVAPRYNRKSVEDFYRSIEQEPITRTCPTLLNEVPYTQPKGSPNQVKLRKQGMNSIKKQRSFSNSLVDAEEAELKVAAQQKIKPEFSLYSAPLDKKPMNPLAKEFEPIPLRNRPETLLPIEVDDSDFRYNLKYFINTQPYELYNEIQDMKQDTWYYDSDDFSPEADDEEKLRLYKIKKYEENKQEEQKQSDQYRDIMAFGRARYAADFGPSDFSDLKAQMTSEYEDDEPDKGDNEHVTVADYQSCDEEEEEGYDSQYEDYLPNESPPPTTREMYVPKTKESQNESSRHDEKKPANEPQGSWYSRFIPSVSLPTLKVKHDIPDELKKKIESLSHTISDVGTKVSDMTTGIKKIIDKVLKTDIPAVSDKFLMVILAIFNIYRAPSFSLKLSILMQALLGLGIGLTDKVSKTLTVVCKYFVDKVTRKKVKIADDLKAQAGEDHTEAANIIHTGVSSVIESMIEPEYLDKAKLAFKTFSIMRFAKELSTIKTGMVAVEVIAKYLLSFCSYIYEATTGYPFPSDTNKVILNEAIDWMHKVKKFIEDFKEPVHALDVEWNRQAWAGYVEGLDISTRVQKAGYKHANFSAFFKMLDLYKPVANTAKEFLGICIERILPVWIELAGEPGAGKSLLMKELIRGCYAAYCQKMKLKFTDSLESMRFNHSTNVKWFDTYKNQFAFVMDDWDQFDDEDMRTENSLHIIRACSPAAYVLPAADISNIGYKFFDSKLIVTTSNIIEHGVMKALDYKLISVDAIHRRCDFFIEVIVNRGYGKFEEVRDPNESKSRRVLNPDFSKSKDYSKIYSFRLWNRRTQTPTATIWNIQELMDHVWAKLEKNFDTFTRSDGIPVYKDPILPTKCLRAQSGKDQNMSKMAEDYVEALLPGVKEDRLETERTVLKGKAPLKENGQPRVFELSPDKQQDVLDKFYNDARRAQDVDGGKVYQFDNVTYLVHELDNGRGTKKFVPRPKIIPKFDKTRWEKFKQYVNDRVDWFAVARVTGSIIGGLLGFLVGFLINFIIIIGLIKMLRYFGVVPDPPVAQNGVIVEATSSGNNSTIFTRKPAVVPTAGHFTVKAQSDMSTEAIINSCAYNMFRVWVIPKDNPQYRYKSGGDSFGGRYLQVPKHLLLEFASKDANSNRIICKAMLVTYNEKYGEQTFDLEDLKNYCVFDASNDKCVMYLHDMKQTKDISHHIITENDLKNCDLSTIIVVGIPQLKFCDYEKYSLDKRYCTNARIQSNVRYNDENGYAYDNAECLAYNLPNYEGMCYYLIFIDNPKVKGKIFGFHAAGNSSRAFGIGQLYDRSYHDEISKFMDNLTAPIVPQSCTEPTEYAIQSILKPIDEPITRWRFDEDKFRVLGTVPTENYHRLLTKSKIHPAPIQEIVGPINRRPVNLSPHDGIRPMQNALDLYGVDEEPDNNILTDTEIYDCWMGTLNKIGTHFEWRKLTEHEAINGVPTSKNIGQMDMTTSGGPNFTGLKKPTPCKNKLYKFNYEVNKYGKKHNFSLQPAAKKRKDQIEAQYKAGLVGVSPVEGNGKDELKSPSKVDTPRLFMNHECEQTILGRTYFGTLIENILESRNAMGCTLGINPHDPAEWQWILKGHKILDPLFQVGDVAHADKRRNKRVARIGNLALVEFLYQKGVLTEEEIPIALGLLSDISGTIVMIIENYCVLIIGWHFSSGSFITAVMQSLYYKNGFILAFMSGNKRLRNFTSVEEAMQYLKEVCKTDMTFEEITIVIGFPKNTDVDDRKNGDDFINIIAALHRWFTCHALKYELETINIDITPALKNGDFRDFYPTNMLDFLKRMFLFADSFLWAPLDWKVICDVFNWDNETDLDLTTYIQQKVDWASIEVLHHGKHKYIIEFIPRVQEYLLSRGVHNDVTIPTYWQTYYKWRNTVAPGEFEEGLVAQSGLEIDEESSSDEDYNSQDDQIDWGLLELAKTIGQATIGGTCKSEVPAGIKEQMTEEYHKADGFPTPWEKLLISNPQELVGFSVEYFAFEERLDIAIACITEDNKLCRLIVISVPFDDLSVRNPYYIDKPAENVAFEQDNMGLESTIISMEIIQKPQTIFFRVQLRHENKLIISGDFPLDCQVYFLIVSRLPGYLIAQSGQETEPNINKMPKPNLKTSVVMTPPDQSQIFKRQIAAKIWKLKLEELVEPDLRVAPCQAQSGIERQEVKPVSADQSQLTTTLFSEQTQEAHTDTPYVHFNSNVDPLPDQGLGKVLSRKYRIATFNWLSTSAQNALVFEANFPKALLDIAPNLQEKINRNHYFRAKVELEFHVAGTLYSYGALMAAVCPFNKGETNAPRFESLWRMSTMDHILISPNSNTVTKITIPFMGQVTHWPHNLTDDEGYFGSVKVRVLFPLRAQNTTSSTSVPVTVFATFVNPEVMGPTLHAQSSSDSTSMPTLRAQADVEAMRVMTDPEQTAKSSSGIVSKSLEFGSRLASACTIIPGAGTIAGMAAAGLFFGSKVARYFGFDKPDNISKFQPVYLTTVNALSNANGMNTVNSLTMDVENQISSKPEDFQTNQCETDFSYLANMPGLLTSGTFDATAVAGTVIMKLHVSPHVAPCTADTIQWLPCSAVASQFLHWRGDMKYCFVISASAFHNFEVRVAFHPTYDEIVLTPEGEGDYPSMVFPCTGDKTIEFKIPYMKNVPYCRAHTPFDTNWATDQFAGAISLSITNPIAPVSGTVDSTVYWALYVSSDPHMDYQTPNEMDTVEANLVNLVLDTYTPFAPPFIAQSAKENNKAPHEIFKRDFPYLFPARSTALARVCFGEQNKSVLDLLHRFHKTEALNIQPGVWYNYRYPTRYTDGVLLDYPRNLAFEFFREWFYFARGGLEYKFIPSSNPAATAQTAGTLYVKNNFDTTTLIYPSQLDMGRVGTVCENFHYKPSMELSIGQYSPYPYWWRGTDYPTQYRGGDQVGVYNGIRFEYEGIGYDNLQAYLFMAVKDDCGFGYPKGCPMTIVTAPSPLAKQKIDKNDNNSIELPPFKPGRKH